MAEIIVLSNVRISFPNLAEARVSQKFPGTPPMFSADFILDQSDPAFAEFYKRVMELATAEWKEATPQVMQLIMADRKAKCFGAGNEKINETTFQVLNGYANNVWINAKNKNQPQMIRPDGKPASLGMEASGIARSIYGGSYVNAAIKPWIRTKNRGVSCDLVAVQFSKDGEPFGESSPDTTNLFGAVASTSNGAPTPGGLPFPAFGAATPNGLPGIPGLPSFLG